MLHGGHLEVDWLEGEEHLNCVNIVHLFLQSTTEVREAHRQGSQCHRGGNPPPPTHTMF